MVSTPRCQRLRSSRGFSLVELSVVVAILSVLATLGLEVAASFVNRSATSITRERLKVVDEALDQYVRVYGRLPCPSPISFAPMHATSGVYDYGLEVCNGPFMTPIFGSGPGPILIGAVPFRLLNLPMSYSLDGFGNKLNYVVTASLTTAGSSGFSGPGPIGPSYASIEVRTGELAQPCMGTAKCSVVADPNATPSSGAAYFVFSSGADQRGVTSARGVAKSPCATTTANSDKRPDAQNCVFGNATTRGYLSAYNGAAWVASTIPYNVFYDNRYNPGLNATSYFDDVAIWRTKGQL